MSENKQLFYRSRNDKILGGVSGGIAKKYNLDINLVRVLIVIFSIVSMGLGALLYLIAWLVFPFEPEEREGKNKKRSKKKA